MRYEIRGSAANTPLRSVPMMSTAITEMATRAGAITRGMKKPEKPMQLKTKQGTMMFWT